MSMKIRRLITGAVLTVAMTAVAIAVARLFDPHNMASEQPSVAKLFDPH